MKQMFFWNSLAFLMIQWMLAIWSLVPLPFLNPAWTSVNLQFMYCWSLDWRILNITLLVCEMNAILWLFEHSLALPFFKTGVKTDLIQPRGHFWVYQIFWHFECSNLIAFTSQDHLNSEVYAVQAIKLTLLCFKMTQPMASLLFLSLFYFFF